MTKSELIARLSRQQNALPYAEVDNAVDLLLAYLSAALAGRQRIEIRGFGSFVLQFRPPCLGRNPRTGTAVPLAGRYLLHFKPGKALRERVNTRGESRPAP